MYIFEHVYIYLILICNINRRGDVGVRVCLVVMVVVVVVVVEIMFVCVEWGVGGRIGIKKFQINRLSPGQNGRHFLDIFKYIFLNENV